MPFDPDAYLAQYDTGTAGGFNPDAYLAQYDKPSIIPQAFNNAVGALRGTEGMVAGDPNSISNVATQANKVVKPFYTPIPMIENWKQSMENAIPGQGMPSRVARGAIDLIPDTPVDIATFGLASGAGKVMSKIPYIAGEDVLNAVKNSIRTSSEKKGGNLIKEATDAYRQMLRPTQGEIRTIEGAGNKNLDDYYNLAAREKLQIGKSPDNKLDTVAAREQLSARQDEIHDVLNQQLESVDKKLSLESLRNKAKNELRGKFKNAAEYEAATKDVDDFIDAEIRQYGGDKISVKDFNNVKQGMWQVGYNAMKPTASKASRTIGHAAKNMIEQSVPDGSIRALNEQSGQYATLSNLLERAHGRVVQGGAMGKYFAKTIGSIVGASTHIPVIGPLAGEWAGGKIMEAISNPETVSRIAGQKIDRASQILGRNVSDFKIGEVISTPKGRVRVTGYDTDGHPMVDGVDGIYQGVPLN